MRRAAAFAIAYDLRSRSQVPPDRPNRPRKADRPTAPRRFVTRIARGLPAATAVFFSKARSPLRLSQLQKGTLVLNPEFRQVGRIEEVIVGIHEGRSSYAVSADHLPDDRLLLVPEDAFGTRGEAAVLRDAGAAIDVPRELALAG